MRNENQKNWEYTLTLVPESSPTNLTASSPQKRLGIRDWSNIQANRGCQRTAIINFVHSSRLGYSTQCPCVGMEKVVRFVINILVYSNLPLYWLVSMSSLYDRLVGMEIPVYTTTLYSSSLFKHSWKISSFIVWGKAGGLEAFPKLSQTWICPWTHSHYKRAKASQTTHRY